MKVVMASPTACARLRNPTAVILEGEMGGYRATEADADLIADLCGLPVTFRVTGRTVHVTEARLPEVRQALADKGHVVRVV